MKILFLDYDGVVNIPVPVKSDEADVYRFLYNFPQDNNVNHKMAVKYIEAFCVKKDYKICVSSSWRRYENYKDCLYNAGLSRNVKIIGRTSTDGYKSREDRIKEFLESHEDIEQYIIIDDEEIIECEDMLKHFIKTDGRIGFMFDSYISACYIDSGWKDVL